MSAGGPDVFYDLSDLEYNESDYNYTGSDTCCLGVVCTMENSMRFEAVFIPILYSLALVLGLLGNGLVLGVLCQLRRSWSVTDTFILHLTVADTLLLLTLPFWAVEAAQGWSFGKPLCKLMGAIFKINFYCGIFLLACISLDRYLSIVHAVQMYSRRKPWAVQASCLCVWIFCLLLSIPDWVFLEPVAEPRRGGKEECTHNYLKFNTSAKDWRMASRLLYHVVGFVLPSLVMVFCYSCILLRLNRGSQGPQKQKAIRVILALVVVFFVSWTPFNITLIADTLRSNHTANLTCGSTNALDVSLTVTSTLGYLHCCMNPVLYAFVGVKFRRHLLEMLRVLGCKLKSQVRPAARKSSMWSESGDTTYTSGF
ncbi:C-X-C chemokine receptor type 3-like [Megalops cyprinoides]|uniref:C-X-C chemokine receptor type 3-like n=1 Tax=Megalops cyprinoides TaxID=118141 RepID=UPI0018642CB9|nr:C-X-C chemokine receptor type 3-like [Megalops cyprinoides]